MAPLIVAVQVLQHQRLRYLCYYREHLQRRPVTCPRCPTLPSLYYRKPEVRWNSFDWMTLFESLISKFDFVFLIFQWSEGQLPKGAAYLDSPKQGERSSNRLGQPPPPQQQLYRSPYEQGLFYLVPLNSLGEPKIVAWKISDLLWNTTVLAFYLFVDDWVNQCTASSGSIACPRRLHLAPVFHINQTKIANSQRRLLLLLSRKKRASLSIWRLTNLAVSDQSLTKAFPSLCAR